MAFRDSPREVEMCKKIQRPEEHELVLLKESRRMISNSNKILILIIISSDGKGLSNIWCRKFLRMRYKEVIQRRPGWITSYRLNLVYLPGVWENSSGLFTKNTLGKLHVDTSLIDYTLCLLWDFNSRAELYLFRYLKNFFNRLYFLEQL